MIAKEITARAVREGCAGCKSLRPQVAWTPGRAPVTSRADAGHARAGLDPLSRSEITMRFLVVRLAAALGLFAMCWLGQSRSQDLPPLPVPAQPGFTQPVPQVPQAQPFQGQPFNGQPAFGQPGFGQPQFG